MMHRTTIAAAALLILAAGCWRDPSTIEKPTRFREAEKLYLDKNFSQAKSRFRELSTSDAYAEKPFRQEALYYTALCDQQIAANSRGGRPALEDAIRTLNEILAAPTYASLEIRALAARGDISLEVNDYPGAAHDYRRALRLLDSLGPISAVSREKLLFGLGLAEWNQRNYSESDRLFDQYRVTYPHGAFVEEARRHHVRLGMGLAPTASFYVLVGGSFTVREQAENLTGKLAARNIKAAVEPRSVAGPITYVVRVGAFDDRDAAETQRRALEAAGFRPAEVYP